MLEETKVKNKYVVLLFSVLALFVVGNLIVDFNILDFLYFCVLIVMGLRFVKIKISKE